MRTPLLLIAATLLAACSDDVSPTLAQAAPAAPPPAPAATEKGDVAAAEVVQPADAAKGTYPDETPSDPCDLSGYDMSQMTVERHEQLVKLCQQSKP